MFGLILLAAVSFAKPFSDGAVPQRDAAVDPKRDYSIDAYGAKADGSKCTAAFARAMDAAAAAGGGRVVVPKGRWTTGAIRFKSNCDLHLCEGAEVVFTQDPADYLPAVHTSWEGMECWNYCPLVYAYCCTNVSITGTGTLRAYEGEFKDTLWKKWVPQDNGIRDSRRQLYDWGATDYPVEQREIWKRPNANTRPHFIQFNRCRNVRWDGFRVRESPFWTLHLYMCDGVYVRGLDVKANGNNNDGIDIEMTRNVLVERCRFDQGDDGVVIKSGRNRDAWRLATPTENVHVRDCRIVNAHTLLGIGSEISGGVRNIRLENCTGGNIYRVVFIKTNRRRGAFVENVEVDGVTVENAHESIVEVDADVLYEWAKFPDYENRLTRIGDISVRNVTCGETDRILKISGDPGLPPRGIRVERIKAAKVHRADMVRNATDVTVDGKDVSGAAVSGLSPSCPDVYVLANGNGRAEISLNGGRLMSWQGRDGKEVLFMPAKKVTPGGDWSHGGIPVCWPWFGRKDGVIHGFIRNKRLEIRRRTADSVTLGFALAKGAEASFPYAADLELTLTLGRELTFAMRTRNTDTEPFTYTEGLHPYFLVGGYRAVTFSGVDAQPFACTDGMDKGFARNADGTFAFADTVLGRVVRARATGNSHVIVWSPGNVEPANRNLMPMETKWFVGYGPAFTKAAGSITLKPGETHELTLSLETENATGK